MKVLCLYHNPCALPLFDWLRREGHQIILWNDRLSENWCYKQKIDLTISYTYRFIIPERILFSLGNNVVNLHNSFLPWNRGADTNLWSILNGEPRGVTLHYVSSELDKGDIIAQRLVPLRPGDTLKTSYNELDEMAREQFQEVFQWYKDWPQMKKRPLGIGSYHSVKDGLLLHQLIDTYDMPVDLFRQRVRDLDMRYL